MLKAATCPVLQNLLMSGSQVIPLSNIQRTTRHLVGGSTLDLIRDRFYWLHTNQIQNMQTDSCTLDSDPFHTYRFELHMDKCKQGCEYVLVVTDQFTRFAQTYKQEISEDGC